MTRSSLVTISSSPTFFFTIDPATSPGTPPISAPMAMRVAVREELGDECLDAIVITTGPHAYRRRDGIGVVPLALLGA